MTGRRQYLLLTGILAALWTAFAALAGLELATRITSILGLSVFVLVGMATLVGAAMGARIPALLSRRARLIVAFGAVVLIALMAIAVHTIFRLANKRIDGRIARIQTQPSPMRPDAEHFTPSCPQRHVGVRFDQGRESMTMMPRLPCEASPQILAGDH